MSGGAESTSWTLSRVDAAFATVGTEWARLRARVLALGSEVGRVAQIALQAETWHSLHDRGDAHLDDRRTASINALLPPRHIHAKRCGHVIAREATFEDFEWTIDACAIRESQHTTRVDAE